MNHFAVSKFESCLHRFDWTISLNGFSSYVSRMKYLTGLFCMTRRFIIIEFDVIQFQKQYRLNHKNNVIRWRMNDFGDKRRSMDFRCQTKPMQLVSYGREKKSYENLINGKFRKNEALDAKYRRRKECWDAERIAKINRKWLDSEIRDYTSIKTKRLSSCVYELCQCKRLANQN